MRLGDLDALTEKLKNGLGNAKNAGKEGYVKIFEVFIDWVGREPTIDAVPVVRCRECRHAEDSLVLWCHEHEKAVSRLDFCSHGARKGKGGQHGQAKNL